MKEFDFKIFHVDRFDHILTISETKEVSFLSYIDTIKKGTGTEIKKEYNTIENRLSDFLVDILTTNCSVSKLKLKARNDQPFSKKESNKLTDWEKNFIQNLFDHYQYKEFNIENLDHLSLVIKLALKEKVRLVIDFDNSIFSSGFDLCMFFQNIEREKLLNYTNKHGLYILEDWYETLWTNEN